MQILDAATDVSAGKEAISNCWHRRGFGHGREYPESYARYSVFVAWRGEKFYFFTKAGADAYNDAEFGGKGKLEMLKGVTQDVEIR